MGVRLGSRRRIYALVDRRQQVSSSDVSGLKMTFAAQKQRARGTEPCQ